MADKKFTNFNPNVNMPGGIGPVNKDIPLIESHYILVEDKASTDLTARLDKKLESIDEALSAINGDGTSGGLSDKIDKSSITTTAPATTNTDTQVPSTKSVATALATKPTGTLTTSVAASGTAADTKIPTEKAVRDAIDSKTITIDSALNTTSTNAIQNKVVKAALDAKQDTLTFDTTPTASSTKPVTSGGVKTALDAKQNTLTFDSAPTASSTNPVTSGGVKTALDAKQDTLTFDTAPTVGSSKPVTSGGVKTALDTKQNTLTFESTPVTGSVNPVTSTGIKNAITSAANANLGAMQAQYDEFVADAQDVLDTAATLSNGMVACADISAETTPGDTRLLIYTGTTDSTYTNGHWYYNSAAAGVAPVWTDGGAVGTAPTVDNTLSTPGAAADAKSVGDAIDDIVTISSIEPDGTGNKIWIKDNTANEVQVPTFEEHIAKANKADVSINNENNLSSASKAYAIGDHFYINDTNINSQTYGASTLYKATAAIAAGDPITVGTNCIAVQLATEVTELSNDLDILNDDMSRIDLEKVQSAGAKTIESANLYNPSDTTPGWFLNGSNGIRTKNADYAYTGYIPISGSQYIYPSALQNTAVYFYDSNKELLVPDNRKLKDYAASDTWPAGTKYCRFNLYTSMINSLEFTVLKEIGYYIDAEQITDLEDAINETVQDITDQIDDIKDEIALLNQNKATSIGTKTTESPNLYKSEDVTPEYYLDGSAGTEKPNPSYGYTGYIPIEGDGYTYSSNIASTAIYFYNENKDVIPTSSRSIANFTSSDNWPNDAKYVRFNISLSHINAIIFRTFELVGGYYISSAQIVENAHNIPVGPTRDIKTLKSAVDYIESIADSNAKYNILLDIGTYNALDGYDLSQQDSSFSGIVLPNNTYIVGQGNAEDVIIAVDGTDFPSNVSNNEVSTLNFYRNNGLKNITIKSKNIRYGIHDDDAYRTANSVDGAVQTFENVIFINEPHTVSGVASYCVGIGMKRGETLKFIRCEFNNQDTTYCAIGFHNGTTGTVPTTCEFDSCKVIANGSYGFRLTTTAFNVVDRVIFKGCKSNKNVLLDKASSYVDTQTAFKLFGYGNSGITVVTNGIELNTQDTEMLIT